MSYLSLYKEEYRGLTAESLQGYYAESGRSTGHAERAKRVPATQNIHAY